MPKLHEFDLGDVHDDPRVVVLGLIEKVLLKSNLELDAEIIKGRLGSIYF
jgi:hypothetical protein